MEARTDVVSKIKKELPVLISEMSTLASEPNSLSLAAQIEITFAHMLLHKLLMSVQDNPLESAKLLSFLHERWRMLDGSSSLSPYSQNTKINRACVKTAKFFSEYSNDLILKTILSFDQACKDKENEILQGEKNKIEKALQFSALPVAEVSQDQDDEKIYRYIYSTFFANQSIAYAFKYVNRNNDFDKKDNWRELLRGVIGFIPDRITLIRILAEQVEKKDWRFFISRIDSIDLYNLILKIPVDKLYKAHKQKPEAQQGNMTFDLELLTAADELLRKKRNFMSYPGDVLKGHIESEHGCETENEVSALAFCLLETYRRVREKLDEYSQVGQITSFFSANVCTKQDKVDACDVVMQFILTGQPFERSELIKYVESEKKEGRLKQSAYEKFNIAIEQGALKMLLDAMFEVQRKVDRANKLR